MFFVLYRAAAASRAAVHAVMRNATLFLSFPYLCPEPVLAKRCILYNNGSKRAFSAPDTASRERSSRLASARSPERKRSVFECIPHICPEPVLVKRSFIYINGFRKAIFAHRPQTCIIIHHDRNDENIDDPLKPVSEREDNQSVSCY